MKKKILIPTDFSENAWNAITYAADLFKDQECTFYILNAYHVVDYPVGDMNALEPTSRAYLKASSDSQDGLGHIADRLDLSDISQKHQFHYLSEYSEPMMTIKTIVEKKDIELVVMGTKGESNNSGALFGSNTITAMEEVRNCPVLGVPIDARLAILKEIVFPTSYETHYKRRELLHMVDLARTQDADICVLHVTTSAEFTETQKENKILLSDCLEGTKYSFHHLTDADRNRAVRNFVDSRNSDMVAIVNRKHGFFEKLFTTPMVKELGLFSKVPLLVMHDLRN